MIVTQDHDRVHLFGVRTRVPVIPLEVVPIGAGGDMLQKIDLDALKSRYAAGNSVRMRRLDTLARDLEVAFRTELPVRVVIFDGDLADESAARPTRVTARELDAVPWAVTSCDPNAGVYTLTRGASAQRYIDQFTIADRNVAPAEMKMVVSQVFERSAHVRRRALQRAAGKCEFCRQPGFATASGEIYLETHHIVPLSESGPDTDDNVAALCANHHKEAHFGESRSELRSVLLQAVKSRGM
ncbi:MAG TPA: HNH endonuclease signature motif containing protein [Polyangiaceae bacterium]|nr:HNH endonuclease signature motif containing protein [Polyangiaceae bacterium]